MNYLVETKKEYTIQLTNLLTPIIYEGLLSIYKNAQHIGNEKEILKIFQGMLRRIPKWNRNFVNKETKRILHNADNWLEDLLKAVIKANIIILTNTTPSYSFKHLDDRHYEEVDFSNFIHKCYIECAREIYTNPYLFSHKYTPRKQKENHRLIIELVKKCIVNAIRKMLPVKDILKEYLKKDYQNKFEQSYESSDTDLNEDDVRKLLGTHNKPSTIQHTNTSYNGSQLINIDSDSNINNNLFSTQNKRMSANGSVQTNGSAITVPFDIKENRNLNKINNKSTTEKQNINKSIIDKSIIDKLIIDEPIIDKLNNNELIDEKSIINKSTNESITNKQTNSKNIAIDKSLSESIENKLNETNNDKSNNDKINNDKLDESIKKQSFDQNVVLNNNTKDINMSKDDTIVIPKTNILQGGKSLSIGKISINDLITSKKNTLDENDIKNKTINEKENNKLKSEEKINDVHNVTDSKSSMSEEEYEDVYSNMGNKNETDEKEKSNVFIKEKKEIKDKINNKKKEYFKNYVEEV